MVAAHLHRWSGTGYRHIPAGVALDVLDTRFAGRATDNRWNDAGDPTLYIAGDRAVAIAEFARHLREAFSPTLGAMLAERVLYRLDVRLHAVLDLRVHGVRQAIGLSDPPQRFLDNLYARTVANFIRRTSSAEALLVPSVAFLDDLSRWNLVLFLEKLPDDLHSFISVTYDSVFRLGQA